MRNLKPELASDVFNGKTYSSQSALARTVGVSETTMRKFLKDNCIDTYPGRIMTCEGVRYAKLVEEEDIKFVLDQYAYTSHVNYHSWDNSRCALLR